MTLLTKMTQHSRCSDCHVYAEVVSTLASGEVALSADQGKICLLSYLYHHTLYLIQYCGYCLSFLSMEYVPLYNTGYALCQISVYYASQPADSMKCSVKTKKTEWKLAPSIIIMFHIIVSVAYCLNLLVFAFRGILDRRLTKLQFWLFFPRL